MTELNYQLDPTTQEHKSIIQHIHNVIRLFMQNLLFIYTGASLLVKSILFLGLVNNDGFHFRLLNALSSFGPRPPLFVYSAFILIFLSFSFLLGGRGRYRFLMGVNLTISLFLIADLVCYRLYGTFFSPAMFGLTYSAKPISGLFSLFHPIDLLFVLDVLLLCVAGLKFTLLHSNHPRNVVLFVLILITSVSYIYFQHYRIDVKGEAGDARLFSTCWVPNQTLTNLSPIGYHLFDLYNYFVRDRTIQLTAAQEDKISQWFADNQENLPPNQYQGIYSGENLIFIQVESLENFVINQKINGQEITPNLNQLLQNSFYLPNFYAPVYNGTSSDADLMANTSVYPVRDGITFFRFPGTTYNSLPNLLERKGYSTLVAHADPPGHYNWIPALSSIGFEQIMDANSFEHDEDIYLGLSDNSLFKQVLPVVQEQKEQGRPFYDYIVTMTSHGPFNLPQEYRTLNLDSNLDATKLGGYFQSIHYTDSAIGSFMQALDQKGILDNTVVVIYGDHAGVHKYYNDEVKSIQPQESWWLDDSERVPLIIYHKGMTERKLMTYGSEIDLLPTAAALLGIDPSNYANTAMGRNLLNTEKDFTVLANKTSIGTHPENQKQEAHAIEGIDTADLIIRSNYFKFYNVK